VEEVKMIKKLLTALDPLLTNAKKWIINNKTEFALLLLILIIGAFIRLFRISEYMTFLGDEGRDAIVVRRLLVDRDIILVGPGTSIGNMYLGPLYYYMMAPALLLANFSPVGPAVMIALLGVLTIFFVWFVTRKWFGQGPPLSVGALSAAFLYAISPTVITYSRSSWNPNIMPFFALLTIYSTWKFWVEKQYKWLILIGISMAFVLQSHYLGLILVPTIGVFWLLTLIGIRNFKNGKWKLEIKKFMQYTLIGLFLFAVLMSPLVIFDARHDWRNFEAIKEFFTLRQTTVSVKPWKALPNIKPIRLEFLERIFTSFNQSAAKFFAPFSLLFISILIVSPIFKRRFLHNFLNIKLNNKYYSYFLLFMWGFFAFVGFGLYKQEIYDHYFGIIFTLPFIMVGAIIQEFSYKKRIIGNILTFVFLLILVPSAFANSPLGFEPNRQLQRSQEVSKKIIDEAGDNKFNIAVIAERNYEGAYQYYLERWNTGVVMIDPQRADDTITDQLFVVCEYEDSKKCDPTHNPKTEIANFGWTKIENEWNVAGVTLYKLVHY
jgi:4-amino-4-deoxy-L-arabinose transferase-like glycosyltransferase